MNVEAPGKLLLLAIVVIGAFALLVTGKGNETAAWSTITAVVGYLVGNGVGAVRHKEQAPVFKPAEHERN